MLIPVGTPFFLFTKIRVHLNMSTAASSAIDSESDGTLSAKDKLLLSLNKLSGLSRIEKVIKSKLVSDAPLLEEIPQYLLELGGKRMRPVLCLLVAKLLGMKEPNQELLDVAAGIELIHMATLLHDDIIDNSPLRRHKESPYIKFGLPSTLLAGDFLLVRAFSLCAHLDQHIVEATETACIELTEGEILETPLFKDEHNLETSLNIAQKKTASLFRLACYSAAHLASGNSKIEELSSRFGENIGISFQILDDILDVVASEDLLGKKSGIDIQERKPSIVNVLWLDSGSELSKRLLKKPSDSEDSYIVDSLKELKNSEVITKAKTIALNYADRARKDLKELKSYKPDLDMKTFSDLDCLVDFVVERMG